MAKKVLLLYFITGVLVGCRKRESTGPIAFSRLTGDHWQIWTMKRDGTWARQLTISSSDKRYPSWSKSNRQLFFRDNNNRAFVLDLSTGEETEILTELGMIGSLVESPKSNELIVVRFRSGIKDSSDLWLISIGSEEQRILTRDIGLQYDPTWSPDGKKIAYISGQVFEAYELFVMDSDGVNKHQLTKNKALELLPAFSPDGKEIAYVSDVTGNYEVWVIDANGSNAKQLTNYEGIDTRPCWSPDGKNILFVSNRSGTLQLWIMNNDGSNPEQLTTGPASIEPAWRIEFPR